MTNVPEWRCETADQQVEAVVYALEFSSNERERLNEKISFENEKW